MAAVPSAAHAASSEQVPGYYKASARTQVDFIVNTAAGYREIAVSLVGASLVNVRGKLPQKVIIPLLIMQHALELLLAIHIAAWGCGKDGEGFEDLEKLAGAPSLVQGLTLSACTMSSIMMASDVLAEELGKDAAKQNEVSLKMMEIFELMGKPVNVARSASASASGNSGDKDGEETDKDSRDFLEGIDFNDDKMDASALQAAADEMRRKIDEEQRLLVIDKTELENMISRRQARIDEQLLRWRDTEAKATRLKSEEQLRLRRKLQLKRWRRKKHLWRRGRLPLQQACRPQRRQLGWRG
jgi:RNase P/RNase MRP subunit p29